MSYIYIAPLKDQTAFKIGMSLCPHERLRGLARYYRFNLDEILIMNCDGHGGTVTIEKAMHSIMHPHKRLQPFQAGSEFYDYSAYRVALSLLDSIAEVGGFVICHMEADFIDDRPFSPIDLSLSALGKRCASRRLNLNITQSELAKKAGVGLRTIQRLESGMCSTTESLIKVMKSLEMSYDIKPTESLRTRASSNRLTKD